MQLAQKRRESQNMAPISSSAVAAAAAAAAACAAYYLWKQKKGQQAAGKTAWKRVLVASTADVKVSAVANALGVKAVGVDVSGPSMVKEQPMGLEETVRGAKNRIGIVIEQAKDGDDAAIAIENGIVRMLHDYAESQETWIDIAVVVVRDLATGAESVSTSMGVRLPTEAIGRWVEDGEEGTIGEILAEDHGCDKHDPHRMLTNEQFSHKALLEEAIKVAMSTPPAVGDVDAVE